MGISNEFSNPDEQNIPYEIMQIANSLLEISTELVNTYSQLLDISSSVYIKDNFIPVYKIKANDKSN